jgi:hypothetical protein
MVRKMAASPSQIAKGRRDTASQIGVPWRLGAIQLLNSLDFSA